MFTLAQMKDMLELQEQLEIRIDGINWRNKGHSYALCVHMECAEIIEHYGWKHWKKQETNANAIVGEMVDVWHFALAHMLQHNAKAEELLQYFTEATAEYDDINNDVIGLCIGMGYSMFAHNRFAFGNFIGLMRMFELSTKQLYNLYVSKNVLNWFRQDHGYKNGTYLKNWGGREDNEHLYEIAHELGDKLTSDELYKALSIRYQLCTM